MPELEAIAISKSNFAPFGDLIERSDARADKLINQGRCGRFHDLANMDFSNGRAGISLFDSQAAELPYRVEMVERHPLGSQAFIPLNGTPYLVVVAADDDGVPSGPQAFFASGEQAINIHRNVWHGVLTPLGRPGLYAVVDRIGEGNNLNEYWFDEPFHLSTPIPFEA